MNIFTNSASAFARLTSIGILALSNAFAPLLQAAEAQSPNLIPTAPGETPDYICTWSLQGYVVNYTGVTPTRDALTETNIFGNGKYQNWADFYPRIRKDLIFLMDDSWDVGMALKNTDDCGGLQLNADRFPMTASATTEVAKLKILNQAFQAKGWRAVGGWVCAQKSREFKDMSDQEFYTQRLKAMNEAGWAYWKVDWGKNRSDEKWRRQLTELSHVHAPKLLVEHAINWDCVPFSDVFRTYDVEVMTSIPVTLGRVRQGLSKVAGPDAKGIINCEDEVVMAATLGCSLGIMRYPFVGNQPDGKQDFVFPPVGRDLKNCINEVERAVLWHRVAPPFKVDGKVTVDRAEIEDSWYFKAREGWDTGAGKWARYRAPARMTRGDLPLPTVTIPSGEPPFVIASRHPNGTVTIATLGRTLCKSETDRSYALPLADITLQVGQLTGMVGVFGRYKSLSLTFDTPLAGKTVLAQDILSLHSTNITGQVKVSGNSLTIPGELIDKIGLAAATPGDKSDPGMVLSISPSAAVPATKTMSDELVQPYGAHDFRPGARWLDDKGVHINAHGGGVLFYDHKYYWFGEHKIAGDAGNVAHVGVHCYSSADLYNWKDEGIALKVSDDPASDIAKGCIVERPKVIYNAATKKFVMWFHLELKGQGYKSARTAVAVADEPAGPYTFVRSLRTNAGTWPENVTESDKIPTQKNYLQRDFAGGQMARDMTLFVDDDGKAYHIAASEENETLHIIQLSDDYQSFSSRYVRVFPGRSNEAPAICKYKGRYWMLASGCTSWDPNAARLSVADSIFGPWKELGNPCEGTNPQNNLGPEKTFGGQSTFILPIAGKPDQFIAMFDLWRPENAIDGRYLWLPITWTETGPKIVWQDRWQKDY